MKIHLGAEAGGTVILDGVDISGSVLDDTISITPARRGYTDSEGQVHASQSSVVELSLGIDDLRVTADNAKPQVNITVDPDANPADIGKAIQRAPDKREGNGIPAR